MDGAPAGSDAPPGSAGRRTYSALHHRNYRLLWIGTLVSNTGDWVDQIALNWLVVSTSGMPFELGPSGGAVRSLIRWSISVAAAIVLAAGVARADGFRLLEISGLQVKWGKPAMGLGAEITYGFATAAAAYPDVLNCPTLAPADRLAAAVGGDTAQFEAIAAAAFDLWSAAADIGFRPARADETPDILIGAQGQPDHIAFANVWHDRDRAAKGVAPLTRAVICLNPDRSTGRRTARVPARSTCGTVLAHEIGHAIGLDHPGPTGALMGYRDQGDLDRLMAGDIAGARLLYGAPRTRTR